MVEVIKQTFMEVLPDVWPMLDVNYNNSYYI